MTKPRIDAFLLVVVAVGTGTFLVFYSWHEGYADLLSDSAIYLLLASKFSLGDTLPEPLYSTIMTNYHLPPGFAFALALTGGGAGSATMSHAVNALFLASGVAAYFAWLRQQGVDPWGSFCLAVLFTLLPATLFFTNFVLSEHLFLPLSLLSLLLLERVAAKPRLVYLAAMVVGLALFTRSLGLALLPALLIVAFRTSKKAVPIVFVISVAIPFLWFLYRSQFSTYGYFESLMIDRNQATIDTLSRIRINLEAVWLYWTKSFDYWLSYQARIFMGLVLVAATVEWVRRLCTLRSDAIYVGAYLAIVLIWPHTSHIQRFLFPLLPILLFYAYQLPQRAATYRQTVPLARVLPGVFLAALCIVALPTHIQIFSRMTDSNTEGMGSFSRSQVWLLGKDESKARFNAMFLNQLYQAIASTGSVAENECVISIDPPRHMLLSRRVSQEPPLPASDTSGFNNQISECKYVFAMNTLPVPNPAGYAPMYPENRLGPGYQLLDVEKIPPDLIVSKLFKRGD